MRVGGGAEEQWGRSQLRGGRVRGCCCCRCFASSALLGLVGILLLLLLGVQGAWLERRRSRGVYWERVGWQGEDGLGV